MGYHVDGSSRLHRNNNSYLMNHGILPADFYIKNLIIWGMVYVFESGN